MRMGGREGEEGRGGERGRREGVGIYILSQ